MPVPDARNETGKTYWRERNVPSGIRAGSLLIIQRWRGDPGLEKPGPAEARWGVVPEGSEPSWLDVLVDGQWVFALIEGRLGEHRPRFTSLPSP